MKCTAAIHRGDIVGLSNGLPNFSSFPEILALVVESFPQFGDVELASADIVKHRAECVVIAVLITGPVFEPWGGLVVA
jgi:hypothetical protein